MQPQVIENNAQPEKENKPVQLMLDLEGLIENHVNGSASIKEEIKKHKEMLDDILASNATYQETVKITNEATKERNRQKNKILKTPHAKELSEKIKELKSDLKEKQSALGDYVSEYKNISGANEVEINGELHTIVVTGRLVKSFSN